jgi:hypothetical protein
MPGRNERHLPFQERAAVVTDSARGMGGAMALVLVPVSTIRALCKEDPLEQTRDRSHFLNGDWQEHECSNYFALQVR